MQHNLTLTCPVCQMPEKAVGNPNEMKDDNSGKWYCFNCKANGDFVVEMTSTVPTAVAS